MALVSRHHCSPGDGSAKNHDPHRLAPPTAPTLLARSSRADNATELEAPKATRGSRYRHRHSMHRRHRKGYLRKYDQSGTYQIIRNPGGRSRISTRSGHRDRTPASYMLACVRTWPLSIASCNISAYGQADAHGSLLPVRRGPQAGCFGAGHDASLRICRPKQGPLHQHWHGADIRMR